MVGTRQENPPQFGLNSNRNLWAYISKSPEVGQALAELTQKFTTSVGPCIRFLLFFPKFIGLFLGLASLTSTGSQRRQVPSPHLVDRHPLAGKFWVVNNRAEVTKQGPWVKSSQLSDFVNKIFPEDRHAHSVTYCLWLLSRTNGRVEDLP